MNVRKRYTRAVRQFGRSKLELQRKITAKAHLDIILDTANKMCYTEENDASMGCAENEKCLFYLPKVGGTSLCSADEKRR